MKLVRGGSYEDRGRIHGVLWGRLWHIASSVRHPAVGFRLAKGLHVSQAAPAPFTPRIVRVEGGRYRVGCDLDLVPQLRDATPWRSRRSLGSSSTRSDPSRSHHSRSVLTRSQTRSTSRSLPRRGTGPNHWRAEPWAWNGRPFLDKYRYHPVVHVTRDDALAYCRWLGGQDGRMYELPTREQWEAAARGPEPRPYPWGDGLPSSKLSNGNEALLARTVDVREHPDGDSHCGCRQMAGNVFEWLSHDGGARYMRGGSFANATEVFGLTFFEMQIEGGKDYQTEQVGFRVVRS